MSVSISSHFLIYFIIRRNPGCQEKRPSNQLNTEKEFLSRLRENVDGLKERLEGMNWKESFYGKV